MAIVLKTEPAEQGNQPPKPEPSPVRPEGIPAEPVVADRLLTRGIQMLEALRRADREVDLSVADALFAIEDLLLVELAERLREWSTFCLC
jgi:hypothetical protein